MKARLTKKNEIKRPNTGKKIISLILVLVVLFSAIGCSKKETPNESIFNPITVVREPLSQPATIANEALSLAVRQFIYAQLLTEDYMTLNIDNTSIKDLIKKSDEMLLALKNSEDYTNQALDMTSKLEKSLMTATITKNNFLNAPIYKVLKNKKISQTTFITPLYAQTGRQIDPQTWAENLSKQYDDLRGAQKYKQLAQQLNTDTKTAYKQMQLASKIIQDASALEEAQAVSAEWSKSVNILQVYKTTAKVSLFATSAVASGGGSLSALAASNVSLSGAGALLVSGTECLIDIGTTSSNIILGEKNKITVKMEDLKDKYSTFSFIVGLISPTESFAGETLAFVGDSLVDLFYDKKIIGIKLNANKDKKVEIKSQVIDIKDLDQNQVSAEVEKAGFVLPSENTKSLQQLIEDYAKQVSYIKERIDELVLELAKVLQNENTPESDESIFGIYTLYATSNIDDETVESKVALIDKGNNKVYWKLLDEEEEEEEEEEDQLIFDYDPQNQTLLAEIGTTQFYLEFNFETDPITADGYFKGLLLGNDIYNEMTMIKD